MAWEENSRICINMQLIAILSRTGVVYTICSINFMFSKSSQLNTSSAEIAEHFGASSSTIAQKSRIIKDLLKISNVFDPDFSLKEIADNNPFNHLVMKNGFIFFD